MYNIFQISQAVSPGNLTDRTIPYMRKEPRRFLGLTGKYADSPEQKNWDALLAGKGTMEIPADSHVTVEIDAGELMTGYLSLRMEDGAEALVKILTAEGYVQKENTGGSLLTCRKKETGATGKTVTFMVLQIPIMWQDTDGNGRRKLMNRSGSVRTVLSGWKSRQEKSR